MGLEPSLTLPGLGKFIPAKLGRHGREGEGGLGQREGIMGQGKGRLMGGPTQEGEMKPGSGT